MEYGTPAQKARFLPKMASSEEVWAQGWSEPNAGSDMAAITDHRAARRRPLRDPAARRPGPRAAPSRTGCSGCSAPTRSPSATTASPSCSCRSTRPASRCGPIAQLDGETGFAEVFFDDVRVPVENRLGRRGRGLEVAMATAGFERGLMLRSPARFQETARAPRRALPRERRAAPSDPLRDDVVRCWIERRGLRARDLPHRVAAARRREDRRRGEPEQDLLVRARPAHARDGAADPRRPRRAAARGAGRAAASATGSTATCSRSRARSTPAPTRSSATSSPSASSGCRGSAWTSAHGEDQLLLQKTVRDFLAKECTPEAVRALWETKTGRSPALWKQLAEVGVPGLLVPEAQGGMGLDETTACCCSRRPAARRSPEPVIAHRRGGRAAARASSAARSPRAGCRASRPARRSSRSGIP